MFRLGDKLEVNKINNRISPIQDNEIEEYFATKKLNLVATLDAEKIIMEDYAYIPVFEKGSATLQSSKVTGLVNAAVGVPWTFTYVDIAE